MFLAGLIIGLVVGSVVTIFYFVALIARRD